MIKKSIKKRVVMYFILIVILLMISSCGKNEKGSDLVSYEFKQGYNGLNIDMLENYPPQEVFTGSTFSVTARLENNGAYDLFNGKVELLGFDFTYIQLFDNPAIKNFPSGSSRLEGKNLENPSGDMEFVEFSGDILSMKEGVEEYPVTFFIKVTYDYSNELVHTVCINPSPYQSYSSGCTVQSSTSFHGQGSPVAITKVEQIISSGYDSEARFIIKIANKGNGQIKSLRLMEASLGSEGLDCQFRNFEGNTLIFEENIDELNLVCEKSISSTNSYETTMYVFYDYTYEISERNSFTVLK